MVSPLVAEAMAVLCGIQLALDSDLCPSQVETDSLSVVNFVKNCCSPPADIGTVISDILACLILSLLALLFLPLVKLML